MLILRLAQLCAQVRLMCSNEFFFVAKICCFVNCFLTILFFKINWRTILLWKKKKKSFLSAANCRKWLMRAFFFLGRDPVKTRLPKGMPEVFLTVCGKFNESWRQLFIYGRDIPWSAIYSLPSFIVQEYNGQSCSIMFLKV